jgi:hypothetical protein
MPLQLTSSALANAGSAASASSAHAATATSKRSPLRTDGLAASGSVKDPEAAGFKQAGMFSEAPVSGFKSALKRQGIYLYYKLLIIDHHKEFSPVTASGCFPKKMNQPLIF